MNQQIYYYFPTAPHPQPAKASLHPFAFYMNHFNIILRPTPPSLKQCLAFCFSTNEMLHKSILHTKYIYVLFV
jgi:hypothetical protein